MRILIITDAIPYPPIGGSPLRIYNLVRRIAQEHEVWLAAFVENPEQAEGVAHMREFCRGVETADAQHLHALARPGELVRYALTGTVTASWRHRAVGGTAGPCSPSRMPAIISRPR